jgi:hypothetical protein
MRSFGHQLAPHSGRAGRPDCCTYCCSRPLACKVRLCCRNRCWLGYPAPTGPAGNAPGRITLWSDIVVSSADQSARPGLKHRAPRMKNSWPCPAQLAHRSAAAWPPENQHPISSPTEKLPARQQKCGFGVASPETPGQLQTAHAVRRAAEECIRRRIKPPLGVPDTFRGWASSGAYIRTFWRVEEPCGFPPGLGTGVPMTRGGIRRRTRLGAPPRSGVGWRGSCAKRRTARRPW